MRSFAPPRPIIWSAAGTTHHIGTADQALEHHQFKREYLGPDMRGTDHGNETSRSTQS